MKHAQETGLKWLIPLLMVLALFRPFSSSAFDDTNEFSWLKLIPPGCWLDSWSFEETNWDSDFGFAPLGYTNIEQVPDWDGNALQVDSTNAAWLTYGITENAPGYGEYTNLTLDTGSIEFWFLPNWQSDDTNFYGNGPGDWGRFIDVGTWTTNADSDWWSLYLNPYGTGIYFSSGTNGVRTNYLSAPISWDGSSWHMVVLTYSPTNTFIYLDGKLAGSGDGVRYVPRGDLLANGFSIGSDLATGLQQAHGQFDDLFTYNYQLSADDISNDYAETYPELPGTFHSFGADDLPPLPGGGGGSGGGGSGGGSGYTPPDYGSNLWVAILGMTNGALSLLETNTMSDVLYELQGCTNLASPNWISFGFVNGSELTNCTPAIAPVSNEGNMFYRVRSWQSIDGIPLWWFLTYLGQDTNVSGEAFSPSGDGWTLLQCYENGLNPTNFVTPPAPQGLTITSFNSTNNTATLSWMLSAGPVNGYIVQTPSGTNIVGGSVNSFVDNFSSESATYSVQAVYGGGLSALSSSVSVEDFLGQQSSGSGVSPIHNVASADFAAGPNGNTYLALGGVPANTATIQLQYVDFDGLGPTITHDFPVSAITNGIYQMPAAWSPPADQSGNNLYDYIAYVETLDANSNASPAYYFSSAAGYLLEPWNWSVPYFDGREQLKQNVTFLLREPVGDSPFNCAGDVTKIATSDYAYAGFYETKDYLTTNALDEFLPFEENYLYRNFVFSSDDVDTNGALTTGIDMNQEDYGNLTFISSPTYQFQPPEGATNISPLLATNDSQWLVAYPFEPLGLDETNGTFYDLADIGITYVLDFNSGGVVFSMANHAQNYFGLPLLSDNLAYVPADSNGNPEGDFQTNLLTPNSSFETVTPYNINPNFYIQTAQPKYQCSGYNFWNVSQDLYYGANDVAYIGSPLPGNPSFTPTNTSDLLITHVADWTFQIAGYAKLAVTNSVYSGVYGYLGQYFANAYQIGSNGSVTTNATGVLSPYGQFFATEPGQAALVTMPDPDTGQQGTGVVDVIALNVDANHDGTMDFSFTGPDFVGPDDPYQFWVNDDADSGDDFGDGIPLTNSPLADGVAFSAYNDNGQPLYSIHGTRDLVDFFPVYINIGSLFQSNTLSAGISYADTNWQFVLSQGDGALRFSYTSLTPANYTNYLRDTLTASNLADALGASFGYNPMGRQFLTTVSNTGVALAPSFIADIATNNGGIILVEAWEPTTQPLVLTIYHGTNQIAQTSLSLSISEVEQMFRHKNILLNPQPNEVPDRLTDADVPNEPPTNDKNFIFVHGYNVNATQARGWDSDYFKRLYWSGSHAKFYGVTWEAADSQVFGAVTINLQTNIVNAFNTAPLLNNFINNLSGTNIVAAHSLGNILVLSTLSDCTNRNINSYFMVDAAVAIEAIDGSASSNPDMYPSVWTGYNGNLLASGWHNLWPSSDVRSALTWGGRLTNFQNTAVYNFYSSGEEVLRDYPSDPPNYLLTIASGQLVSLWKGDTGLYTWAWQEKLKGLMSANFLLSSDHGGWQFNPAYSGLTVTEANALPDSVLQTNAFFNFSSPSFSLFPFTGDLALETSSGSSYAQANRNRILSDAIPCLTLPVGANPVPDSGIVEGNFDMQLSYENGWPADRGPAQYPPGTTAAGEWHHSDNRAVAYTFTYKLFNQMVTLGNLR